MTTWGFTDWDREEGDWLSGLNPNVNPAMDWHRSGPATSLHPSRPVVLKCGRTPFWPIPTKKNVEPNRCGDVPLTYRRMRAENASTSPEIRQNEPTVGRRMIFRVAVCVLQSEPGPRPARTGGRREDDPWFDAYKVVLGINAPDLPTAISGI